MTTARDTASQVSAIIDLAAVFANDTNARNRRWSNTQYIQMLNGMLKYLQTLATGSAPDAALASVAMTYDASLASNVVPAAAGLQQLAFIQDNRNTTQPVTIPYWPPTEVESGHFRGDDLVSTRSRWTQRPGEAPDFRARFVLFPATVGNIDLLVWYVSPELIVTTILDTFPLSTKWTELVALGVASRLLGSAKEGISPDLAEQRDAWLREYANHGQARRGPRKVPNRRKGIS